MKQMKKYIMMAVASLALSGCGDFLEPDSTSEFVPKDVVSFNEILLGSAYPRYDIDKLSVFMNLLDDDVTGAPYQEKVAGYDPNIYLSAYAWNPSMFEMLEKAGVNAKTSNMYSRYYELIMGCNAVLDYVVEDDVIGTEEEKENVMAQAYALRAFYYLSLVNIFGQPYNVEPEALGVPLKLNSGIEEDADALKRRSVKDCYEQILKDLTTAEELYKAMPLAQQWSKDFRTSLPMVQLLLSRTYLYMEEWEKAAEYSKMVMDNRLFKLYDLADVPTQQANDYGQMVNVYTDFHSYSSPEAIWLYGNNRDMVGFVNEYSDQSETGAYMHAYVIASPELMNSYDDKDLRKDRYIVRRTAFGKYDENGDPVVLPMAYGKIAVGETSYRPHSGQNAFARSLRLSEAYLNYAEAKAMLNLKGDAAAGSEAASIVNQLRMKRFTPEDYEAKTFASPEELLQFVKDERRREFCFEGLRWNDLRRWGRQSIEHVWYPSASQKTTYVLDTNDLMFAVPVPNEAMNENGKLEQNKLPNFKERPGKTIEITE